MQFFALVATADLDDQGIGVTWTLNEQVGTSCTVLESICFAKTTSIRADEFSNAVKEAS